ncbi:unnamed protein product, partial [Rotaria magnacalcarata]
MQDNATAIISSRENQAYILAATTIYDKWVRNNYDLQVWQNYLKVNTDAATKRVEYDLPPKFISNIDFTFKIDESIFSKDEAQALYNQMRHITKEYRIQAMSLYVQSTNRECEILTDEIKHIIEGFPRNTEENDEQVGAESGYIEFKHYNELREKRLNLDAERSIYFLEA